ncbi:putative Major facilitator superfamily transporter [Seiridium unicorne]|uniref:Major facilitator superfamily transporter n=1 Tax=Seiridium unicorne TaxID=138068 RepID=A0ABR2VFD6_9PEZI
MDDHDQDYDGSTEQTPLVTESDGATHPRRPPYRSMLSVVSVASIASINVPKVHNGNTIVILLCGILLVAASANGFVNIPLTKLVENVVCHQYYDQAQSLDVPIEEKLCKVPAVQSKMAYIFATVDVCEAIAGLLAAFPWGIAADRIGRRPVFATALTGIALSILWMMAVLWFDTVFPPSMIASACLWRFVGGGNAVVGGILLSMVSDVIPEDKRATAFMRVHVSALVGGLVSPALSSAMMAATGPWPVMLVGIACLLVGAAAFMFVPETLQHKQFDATGDNNHPTGFKGHVHHTVDQLKDSISMLKSPSLILVLLTCLTTYPIAAGVTQFLVQFVSKRYEIPIQSTGYVQTAYGLAQIVQALLILPWLSRLLMQDSTPKLLRRPNEQERDLSLAKWSFGLVSLGFFVLAMAPTLWMFVFGLVVLALGSAAASLVRSLMSLYVDPEHRSRLFSLVGMVETVGNMYGPPMLAGLFSLGMKLGEPWIGLPYFGIMALSLTVLIMLLFVRVPKQAAEAPPPPPPYEEARVHQD